VTAISNGAVLFGLVGSAFIYKEQITKTQVGASCACFAGILILSLSTLFLSTTSTSGVSSGTEVVKDGLRFVIYESLLSLCFFGSRIILSKYCSRVLSAIEFVKINFMADATCGILLLILASTGLVKNL